MKSPFPVNGSLQVENILRYVRAVGPSIPILPFPPTNENTLSEKSILWGGGSLPAADRFLYLVHFFRFLFCLRRVFSGPQIFAGRMNGEKCNKIEWIQKCLIQTYVMGSSLPHWTLIGHTLFYFAFVLFSAVILRNSKIGQSN